MGLEFAVWQLEQAGYKVLQVEEIHSYNVFESDKFKVHVTSCYGTQQAVLKIYKKDSRIQKCFADIQGYRQATAHGIQSVGLIYPRDPLPENPRFLLTEFQDRPVVTLAKCDINNPDYNSIVKQIAQEMARLHRINSPIFGYHTAQGVASRSGSLFDLVFDRFENKIVHLERQDSACSEGIRELFNTLRSNCNARAKLEMPSYDFVHGNLDSTNILVDPSSGSFVSFIDWKYSFFGNRHYDLSYHLRWLNPHEHDMRIRNTFLEAYDKSYGESLDQELYDFFDEIHILRMGIIKIIEKYQDNKFNLQELFQKYGIKGTGVVL
jgi:aminoglycoside phosphotransferase